MPPFPSITGRKLPFIEKYCPILAFIGCPVGFHLLRRNPDFKDLFGAKEGALVDAFLSGAEYLVPFLCFCNLLIPQMKDKCKTFLPLNVFLHCLSLAVPAIMGHLAEYPGFHIKIKDVKQHNSRKIRNLYTSFAFAITSWAFSKTYGLSFECGFFSGCLGYAMLVSLSIVDKTGNGRDICYILGAYIACFLFILLRKYLEIDEGSNTARQSDDQSSNDKNSGTASQNPIASETTHDLWSSPTESSSGSVLNQPIEVNRIAHIICGDRTSRGLRGKYGSSRRDAMLGSCDINEHFWDGVPQGINLEPSNSSRDTGDGEDDVPNVSKCEAKEGFIEGTMAIDFHVGRIEESEFPCHQIDHEEHANMRSSTSSVDMEMNGSLGAGVCEKDNVPLLLPKSSILIKGESPTMAVGLGQIERYACHSQGGSDHDSPDDERSDGDDSYTGKGCKLGIGKDPDLEEEESLKVDKDDGDDSSDDKGSDGDGFHSRTGCKPGVDKDPDQEEEEEEGLKVDKDDGNDDDRDSSDDEGSDDDGFHSGTGCKLGVGRDPDPDQEEGGDIDTLEIANSSNLGDRDVPLLLSESKNEEALDLGQKRNVEHGEMSTPTPSSNMKMKFRVSNSGTTDLQASQTESSGGLARNQLSELALNICGDMTSEGLMGNDGDSRRNATQESCDGDEHHWDIFSPSSSPEETEDGAQTHPPF